MAWKELLEARRIVREDVTRAEIEQLIISAERNAKDAGVEGLSTSGQFEHAYAWVRILATVVIRVCGYRVRQAGSHYYTFRALEAADPERFRVWAVYFDSCRAVRNSISYEGVHAISESDRADLIDRAAQFEALVWEWLETREPEVLPPR